MGQRRGCCNRENGGTSMKKFLCIVGVSLALVFVGATAAQAEEAPAPGATIVLWEKPAATFGPQHIVKYQADTGSLAVFDSVLSPGKCYQVDRYVNGAVTSSLIEGGVLNAPNQPQEALVAGGQGVAYKTLCIPVVVPPVVPPVVVPPVVVTPPVVTPPVVVPPVVVAPPVVPVVHSVVVPPVTKGLAFTGGPVNWEFVPYGAGLLGTGVLMFLLSAIGRRKLG
jgi:hypothetical protein